MSAMGLTAVPGLLFRPLCRIQQLSILFPLWRCAPRQVPNGSPANLQSAISGITNPFLQYKNHMVIQEQMCLQVSKSVQAQKQIWTKCKIPSAAATR